MCYPLWKRNMKQMVKPFIILFAVLTMYYGVIIYMYDPELMSMLNDYQKLMPELMAAVGMTGATDTLLKFINTYLYGFLMMLFPLIYMLIMGNQYLMRYEDSGSLAEILSAPYSRGKIIVTQAASMLLSVVILMAAVAVMGYGFAEGFFSGELDVRGYIELNLFATLLQLAISAIIFFTACIFQESRNYYALACGLPLMFYLFSMLGNMGDTFAWMKNVSIYSLLPADKIINGDTGTGVYLVVQLVIIVVLYGAGIWRFQKKDLFL